jgi:methylase of polypeptide subunit release factors
MFNIKIGNDARIHWDFTTIILKKCLKNNVRASHSVLEMGTGPFALLSIWLSRKRQCIIDACDINGNYVKSALQCIEQNNASLKVIQSNLFENIGDSYNVIFFNSVYIPEDRGIADGIGALHEYETDWCGGKDGLQTIRIFLTDSKKHLLPNGKLLLGFNTSYLKAHILRELCESLGYTIKDVCSYPLYPSRVFVLEPHVITRYMS